MSEKLAEVYEQYDMEILSSKKGRGSTILTTSNGLRILEPFRGNITRLEQEYILKQLLSKHGCTNIDSIFLNKDEQLLSYDKYRQPFVLKLHFQGEECDMHKEEDVIKAVKTLAQFHIYGREIIKEFHEGWNIHLQEKEEHRIEEIRQAMDNGEDLEKLASLYEISEEALNKVLSINTEENMKEEIISHNKTLDYDTKKSHGIENVFERHNMEMKKIQKYISRVKRKNEFEKTYLRVYDGFYDKGVKCLKMISDMSDELICNDGGFMNLHYGICHGSYNQHNVIIGENVNAIVHFERFSKGNQLNDLYQFARKVMEKNHFDYELLQVMFEAYKEYIPLNGEDYRYMYVLFAYPEKFWKIANSYYNTNKAFLSPKYMEKLDTVILQEEEKQALLNTYREKNHLFN